MKGSGQKYSMSGPYASPAPNETSEVLRSGPFVDEAEEVEFAPGVPDDFVTWRPQADNPAMPLIPLRLATRERLIWHHHL